MSIILWVLGTLSLLGGLFASIGDENGIWLVAGITTFAVFGGFATVITLLEEIKNGLKLSNEKLAELIQKQASPDLVTTEGQHRKEEEAKRLEEQRRKEEEAKRLEEQRRKEEEAKRLEEQRRKEEEAKRLEEQRRKEEEAKRLEEQRKKEEEAKRLEEQRRKEEEAKRLEEQRKKEEEAKRFKEQRRKEEEAKQLKEKQKKEEKAKRLEEQRRKMEEASSFEEQEEALWLEAEAERLSKFGTIGESVLFGKYQQQEQTEPTDIEWIVIDTDEDHSLLLSKMALDSQQFNNDCVKTSWEQSDIRKWLNRSFLENAFSTAEQSAICLSKIPDDNTDDKVLLLSRNEAKKYFVYNHKRSCQITPYAENQGAYCNNIGKGWWWLRSTDDTKAFCVDSDGKITSIDVDNGDCAVRPAIWVSTELLPRESLENT